MEQIEHQGRIQCNFRFFPEGVRVIGVLWSGVADQIVHQFQHIGLVADIGKGVISVRLAGVNQVEHHDFIPHFFEQIPGGTQQLPFRIGNDIGTICTVKPGFCHEPGLTRAGAAHHNNIEITAVLVAVEADTDILRQDDIR